MKSFCCGDVVPGCDARFLGDSEAAILGQVARHAAESHDLPAVPTEVVMAVRDAIRTVPSDEPQAPGPR